MHIEVLWAIGRFRKKCPTYPQAACRSKIPIFRRYGSTSVGMLLDGLFGGLEGNIIMATPSEIACKNHDPLHMETHTQTNHHESNDNSWGPLKLVATWHPPAEILKDS